MLYGHIADLSRYHALLEIPALNQAFSWIQSMPPAPPCETYALRASEMFVNVMTYTTTPPEDSRFESHRKYIDLQYTIGGGEHIEVRRAFDLLPDGAYHDQTDLQFYCPPDAPASTVNMQAGWFSIFFPEDAHRPKIRDGIHKTVYKLVVKISCDLVA